MNNEKVKQSDLDFNQLIAEQMLKKEGQKIHPGGNKSVNLTRDTAKESVLQQCIALFFMEAILLLLINDFSNTDLSRLGITPKSDWAEFINIISYIVGVFMFIKFLVFFKTIIFHIFLFQNHITKDSSNG